MKRWIVFCLLFISATSLLSAQTTTVNATVVDSDGITWNSGSWKLDFRPNNNYTNPLQYKTIIGTPLSPSMMHQSGSLSNTGVLAITTYDSTLISPIGSGWTLTVCPLASSNCGIYNFSTSGSSMNISSNLTAVIPPPRFNPGANSFGYSDVEVITALNQGGFYWNIIDGKQHYWNGVSWITQGGSGTVNPGGAYKIAGYPVSSAQTVNPLNCTGDNTGNNLSCPGTIKALLNVGTPNLNNDLYPFGLVNDGGTPSGTDNTAVFQGSIAQGCSLGGAIIHVPAGVYNVYNIPGAPRPGNDNTSHIAALIIPCSNITIQGAGVGTTTISVWQKNADGSVTAPTDQCPKNPDFDPATDSAFNLYRVWRGSGIYIVGGTSSGSPTSNVHFKDFRITGNAFINGWNRNPTQWDNNLSIGIGSVCNAWDTSHKGIYLQNDNFTPTGTGWPNDSAFYPGANYYFNNIGLDNIRVDHFLGELVYQGGYPVTNSHIFNTELDDSNGDCISVGGNWDNEFNYCHDVYGQGDEDTEDFVIGATLNISNNRYKNIGQTAITPGGNAYPQAGWVPGKVIVKNNIIENATNNGIAGFSLLNADIIGNKILNSGWNVTYVSSGIQLSSIQTTQAYAAAPAAPASPITITSSTTGGTIPANSYLGCVTWSFQGVASLGYTACSFPYTSVTTTTSTSTITFTEPSSPPAGATGWFQWLCSGTSCTPYIQGVQAANGNLAPTPLGTTSVTLTAPSSFTLSAPSTGQITAPANQNVNVVNNTITADWASTWVGIRLSALPFILNYPYASNLNILSNSLVNSNLYANDPVAAPSAAPITTQFTNSTGQPYLSTANYPNLNDMDLYAVFTWTTPQCETLPSLESHIKMANNGAGLSNIFRLTPNSTAPADARGIKVYVGTTPGGPYYLQTSSGWFSTTIPYTMAAPLVTSATPNAATPPISACNGVVANHMLDKPSTIIQSGAVSNYNELGNNPSNVVAAYDAGTTQTFNKIALKNVGSSTNVLCADGNGSPIICPGGGGTNLTVASTTLTGVTATTTNSSFYVPAINHGHYTMNATIRTTTAGSAGTATVTVACGQFSNSSSAINLNTLNSVQTITQRSTWNTGDGGCNYGVTVTGNTGGQLQADIWIVAQ